MVQGRLGPQRAAQPVAPHPATQPDLPERRASARPYHWVDNTGAHRTENAEKRTQPMIEVADPILAITDQARDKILEVRAAEPSADALALWVTVDGEAGGAFTYDMAFRALDDAGDTEVLQRHGELPVVIDGDSIDALAGATLDFTAAGMVMQNPNRPALPPAPWADADVEGPVAQSVLQVLEEIVNPQIASHGGRAELVGVDGSIVYLRMMGGCQGCSSASATLSQGIEVILLDRVPEITEVIDVTDHEAGTNPYYAWDSH